MTLTASFAPQSGRSFRLRRRVLETPLFGLSLGVLMAAGAAQAAGPVLPTGGKVVAGQASIGAANAGSLTVNQSSSKAIINWNGFSIGSGGKVQFDNGSGATLNRVTGTSVSSLNGLLSATGSLYLLNPNGVIVGRTGVVNVGGTFVASTLNVSDQNFLAGGNLAFTGNSNAAVVNLGKVGALGGDVALIAATVDNEGSVTAANGTAGLISGYSVVMRDASLNDGLFSVLVGGPNTGVTNGGAILAANAELRAEGGNVYALAGNTAGVIRATGVKAGQGKVWLVADGGALDVGGTIEAKGAGRAAGAVETSGRNVTVGAANIDAHGGTWLVDPVDLTIDTTAASTIDASLNNGTNVTESTSATGSSGAGTTNASGAGDIIVAAPISWTTAAGLTLSAYRNVDVNAAIASSGGGAVTLQSDNAATGTGTVAFGGGSVSTSGLTTILYNPASYTTPTSFAANVTGGGTLAAYMLVNTAAELQAINTNLSGDYALNPGLSALDLSSISNFTPIGSDATPFTGVFNGAPLGGQREIDNLTIDLPNAISVGLFGNVGASGVVEQVALEGGSITGEYSVGGIAGKNSGTISDTDVDLAINGQIAVGGIAGKNFGIIADDGAGLHYQITGVSDVGGIAGYNGAPMGSTLASTASITNVYPEVTVSGSGNAIGGVVGYNSAGSVVSNVQYYGLTVNGLGSSATAVGGIIGENAGTVSAAQAYFAVVSNTGGGASTGGLVGLNDVGATVSGDNAQYTAVHGGDATGGLVGKNYGTVTGNDALHATVTGADAVGGIVGKNFDVVDSSYIASSSTVSGANYVGGVVGWNTTPTGSTAASTASVQDQSYTGVSTRVAGTGNYVGGLVGYNDVGSVVSGSTDGGGLVTGAGASGEDIGGLVGYNAGSVSASNSYARVVEAAANTGGSADYLGGAVGYNASTGTINAVTAMPDAAYTASYGATGAVVGSYSQAGGLVGYNAGAISASTSSDTVTTTGNNSLAGGLVGYNDAGGTIDSSSASGAVTVPAAMTGNFANAGGLVGYNDGSITNSTASSAVSETGTSDASSSDILGGLVAQNDVDGVVSGSRAGSTVSAQGTDTVGGLVGQNDGMITGSAAKGAVSVTGASSAHAGGLVGYNDGTIGGTSASFAVGAVTVDGTGSYAGGLVGDNEGTISQAYSTGAVTDTGTNSQIGGLVGHNDGGISYAYALGAVTAQSGTNDNVGGLVGYNDAGGTISQAYATGAVSGGANDGGVAGQNLGTIDGAVYWDETTTGQTAAAGGGGGSDGATAINVSGTLSPYAQATYANLDFTSTGFVIFPGSTRPFLRSEASTTIINLHQLQLMGLNPTASYTLAADIDASPTGAGGVNSPNMWSTAGFSPIGTDATPFTGTFNGADPNTGVTHTVSNLTIDTPTATSIGLFGNVGAGGEVENLTLTNAAITGFNAVGAAAGKNSGLITDITVTGGTITGHDAVGGVVGKNFASVDYATTNGVTVDGADYVGGIVGYNTAVAGSGVASVAEVSYANAAGTVTGTGDYVGGVVGYNDLGSTLTDDVAVATVSGALDVGGLVGFNAGALTDMVGTVAFSGAVAGGAASNVGGVVGYNSGTVDGVQVGPITVTSTASNSSASGIGGVVGYNASGGVISDVSSDADVSASGASAVGGVAGKNYGSVTSAVFSGAVGGLDAVGGVVGKNFGSVSAATASSSSTVSGRNYVGGVVGWNTGAGSSVSSSQANIYVSGISDVGGLVGRNDAGDTISGSWSTLGVNDAGSGGTGVIGPIGGLVGYNAGAITTSYSSSPVSSSMSSSQPIVLGGLIGENAGAVSDVYSVGSVLVGNSSPGYVVGGLVGQNDAGGSITRAYASGALGTTASKFGSVGTASSISGTVGGFAGTNAGTLSNVYFDQSTTTEYNAVGSGSATGVTRVGGSSNDPYAQATYAGFDFGNTWYIVDGSTRPILRSEYSTTITNAHQLQLMALDLGATYRLAGNFSASATGLNASDVWRTPMTADANGDYGFVPVGSDASPFTGTLIGGGYEVQGLSIVRPTATSVGLFGNVGASALVEDLGLIGSTTVGLNAVGSLAGKNSGTLISDFVEGATVQGSGGVGGVIGKNFGSASFITADADVTGDGTYVGGLIGYNGSLQGGGATTQALLSYGSFDGTVTNTTANTENDVGGLVGYNDPNAVVLNSNVIGATVNGAGYAVGGLVGKNYGGVENNYIEDSNVTGQAAVGGVVGKNFGNVSYDSYYYGTVSGAQYVGGLVGYNGVPQGSGSTTPATVFNSYFNYAVYDATVTGTATTNAEADVGGLVGYNDAFGQITRTSTDAVTVRGAATTGAGGAAYGGYSVGGLVGKNYGLIENAGAYSQTTTGSAAVGGIVGKNFGTVSQTTADGTITGDEYVGGLVGYNGTPSGSSSTTPALVALSLFDFGSVSGNGVTGAMSEADAGGLIGYNGAYGQVTLSATGTNGAVTVSSAGDGVGGAVGKNYGSVTVVKVADGTVTGYDSVGGLVGRNFGSVSQAESEAGVTGADYVGGAIGYSGSPSTGAATQATVDQVVALGAVSWSGATGTGNDFGGLIGWNAGSVTNAYSEGAVENMSGMTNVGGFVGYNTDTVSTSYTISLLTTPAASGGGAGTPGTNAGAFAGDNAGTFTNDYYDLGINGATVPGVATGTFAGVVGLTATQAMMQSAYQGFDFTNIWSIGGINSGYPYLQAESELANF